jgi:hypothetical protein
MHEQLGEWDALTDNGNCSFVMEAYLRRSSSQLDNENRWNYCNGSGFRPIPFETVLARSNISPFNMPEV